MKRQKVSAMVIDFAGDYINEGETRALRKNRLTLACTAWNYSCVSVQVGLKQLDKYMGEYRKWSPDATEEECSQVKEEMKTLMEHKRQKYPNIALQIVSSDLVPIGGEERVVVAFAPQDI